MQVRGDENDISIPMDIIGMLSQRYGIKINDLLRAYIRGVQDGLADRANRH